MMILSSNARRHNRQFPDKLGKRPDLAKSRRSRALEQHEYYLKLAAERADKEKCKRLQANVDGTKRNLGIEV